MTFRKHNQTHCFALGREAGLENKPLTDNIFDDEKETQKYIWWYKGWEFGQSELEENKNGS